MEPAEDDAPRSRIQAIGLGAGAAAFALVLWLGPSVWPSLNVSSLRLLAVIALMAIWWATEALPLAATALVPAACFPLLGIAPAKPTTQAYMSPIIVLLLGGFMLARAVERSGVHRRLALYVLLGVGGAPRRLVLGFALASGLLSMWISNTASTLIILPIALALLERAESESQAGVGFGQALLLAIAYGASVGGMSTPIGTPPNLIAMNALEQSFPSGPTLSFLGWVSHALPAVLLLLPLIWFILTRFAPGVPAGLQFGGTEVLRAELRALGPWRAPERRALSVFGFAGLLWVTRPDIRIGTGIFEGWATRLGLEGVHDGTVAMVCALLAFGLPDGTKSGQRLLPWNTAAALPWGLILFFGGGVALSVGFLQSGLSQALGGSLAGMAGSAWAAFIAVICFLATFGTEVISNTALANILMPILAATAKSAAMDPRTLLVPAAMACSCAFMMPIATGPNAIVFGSGRLRVGDMLRAGLPINLAAWACIVGLSLVLH
ncbi:MAG: SLC13 family permease [Myxococcota bacterium]